MFYWYFSSGLAKITQKLHHLHVHQNALTIDIFSFPKVSSMRTKLIVPLNTKLDGGSEGGNALVGKKLKLEISSYIEIIGLFATYERKSRFHLNCCCKLPFYTTSSPTPSPLLDTLEIEAAVRDRWVCQRLIIWLFYS